MTIKEIANKKYNKLSSGRGIITFFTPTYNRAVYLHRIEGCLKKQTNNNYVWILVNDGSQDNTEEIAIEILEKNELPMLYLGKENGGKHAAFKEALERCHTEFFACLDDDDLYAEESVAFFLKKWKQIKEEGADKIGAIRVLTKRHDGSIMADFKINEKEFGKEYDISTLEMNFVHYKHMENWTCYDTERLKSVDLFPSGYWLEEQHKYFGEGLWQSQFARKYKCRYVYVALREYNSDDIVSIVRGEYTPQKKMDKFINSYIILNEQWDYITRNVKSLVRAVVGCNVKRMGTPISLKEHLAHCNYMSQKLMLILFMPVSYVYKVVKDR